MNGKRCQEPRKGKENQRKAKNQKRIRLIKKRQKGAQRGRVSRKKRNYMTTSTSWTRRQDDQKPQTVPDYLRLRAPRE